MTVKFVRKFRKGTHAREIQDAIEFHASKGNTARLMNFAETCYTNDNETTMILRGLARDYLNDILDQRYPPTRKGATNR